MIYAPFLLICSLATGFTGDKDTGSTCRVFYDLRQPGYETMTACQARAEEMMEELVANKTKLHRIVPGPWHIEGQCRMEVLNEKVV